jgi:hypothetical protein
MELDCAYWFFFFLPLAFGPGLPSNGLAMLRAGGFIGALSAWLSPGPITIDRTTVSYW